MRRARHTIRSWERKNTGKGLEGRMATMAGIYDQRGILTLEKVDPPTRMVMVGSKWVAVQMASPFLDFVGVIKCENGRAIFMEAKSGDEPRLDFGGKSGVNADQLANLRRWKQAGAVTGVLYEYRGAADLQFFWVDQEDFTAAALAGRKSVPVSSMTPVPPGISLIADFWRVIQAKYYPTKAQRDWTPHGA